MRRYVRGQPALDPGAREQAVVEREGAEEEDVDERGAHSVGVSRRRRHAEIEAGERDCQADHKDGTAEPDDRACGRTRHRKVRHRPVL